MSVENITPFGIWLFVKEKEYFLSYEEYPYFKDQTLKSIQDVRLNHGYHLYWPELDVDLEIDNLENPEKYPLKSRALIARESSKRVAKLDGGVKRECRDIKIGEAKHHGKVRLGMISRGRSGTSSTLNIH